MGPAEVWGSAARLAPRLAGTLGAFLAVLGAHLAAWIVGVWLAATHELATAVIVLGAAASLSLLLAPVCRDASRFRWSVQISSGSSSTLPQGGNGPSVET